MITKMEQYIAKASVLIEAVLGAAPHCRLPHPILLRPDGTFTQYEPDR